MSSRARAALITARRLRRLATSAGVLFYAVPAVVIVADLVLCNFRGISWLVIVANLVLCNLRGISWPALQTALPLSWDMTWVGMPVSIASVAIFFGFVWFFGRYFSAVLEKKIAEEPPRP
jgi:xanthine/uracil/vitamin C permease (AzgA family)